MFRISLTDSFLENKLILNYLPKFQIMRTKLIVFEMTMRHGEQSFMSSKSKIVAELRLRREVRLLIRIYMNLIYKQWMLKKKKIKLRGLTTKYNLSTSKLRDGAHVWFKKLINNLMKTLVSTKIKQLHLAFKKLHKLSASSWSRLLWRKTMKREVSLHQKTSWQILQLMIL